MGTPNAEKGSRYLGLLDQALCSGNWGEVAELARKTDKHASNRTCLTLAARSEAQIANTSSRPSTASSTGLSGLSTLVPQLEKAVSVGESIEEDAFVAGVCLAQIHWLQGSHEAALRALPTHIPRSGTLSSLPSALGWIEVCGVKSTYIRGTCLHDLGREQEAEDLWRNAVQQTPGYRSPELRRWTEKVIAQACSHFYNPTKSGHTPPPTVDALRAFSAWNGFWQRSPSAPDRSTGPSIGWEVSRRQTWWTYYLAQSHILHPEQGEHSPARQSKSRLQQYSELRNAAKTYESSLMSAMDFPKATQYNGEIEDYVQQAMMNWRVVTGTSWADSDLLGGGKEAASREMLDMLYLAATKTFHSTQILRSLFNVHASLGEFDLAMHAFDSYVEIISKGKTRAAKTGKHELGFDDDDIALLTAAEAIRLLCRYGGRDQAEKAVEVGKDAEHWLDQQKPVSADKVVGSSDDNKAETAHPVSHTTETVLQPATLAAAYRALGVSKSHWAALTYDTEARSGLFAEARSHLDRSLKYDSDSVETVHALALLLAETRNVNAAIAVIRPLLATRSERTATEAETHLRETQLLPLWHLLSLCLSAKDQHESAVRMCEAAFEQFGEPSTLFGNAASSLDPEKMALSPAISGGVVDQMDGYQKEGIVQIKMSQLTYVELVEGPNAAMDMTDELLALYARLFGTAEKLWTPKLPTTANAMPPPSRGGGTLRSVVGSIRPKSRRTSVEKTPRTSLQSLTPPKVVNGTSAGSTLGPPIAITVTNENGNTADQARGRNEHRHHLPFHIRHSHSAKRSPSGSNLREANTAAAGTTQLPSPVPEHTNAQDHATKGLSIARATTADRAPSSLPQIQHMNGKELPRRPDEPQSPSHIAARGSPSTSYPAAQRRRHKMSLLVRVWLFIAELYIRAEGLDDASGAVDEAAKLVEALEVDVGAERSSARGFFDMGWGGGASVDELWADVWSTKGDLALVRTLHFDAVEHYEHSLAYFPDHSNSIIALSELLMDMYEQKLPTEPSEVLLPPIPSSSIPSLLASTTPPTESQQHTTATRHQKVYKDPTPAELNRLAARDRAYLLLSTLTRLGTGWDDSEAWLALARNHELSGQVGKAKEALRWVVELEDARPVRSWRSAAVGGYTL
ncbi:hypothetical protein B0A48_09444 [Cryoendolithus antarcticus]|uniref:Filamentation protein n=1 Tax=Cryoendolithus antarcticus TaxID=1507870 RepID=A0A1V8T044_9PEZI|nr:hypothetical protein B0A48_09444 [Cryoendolithus antarcticus]